MTHGPPDSAPAGTANKAWLACWRITVKGAGEADLDSAVAAPLYRAIASRTMARSSCSFIDFNLINDADDSGIDRCSLSTDRLGGGAAFDHYQHLFVHPCSNRIDGEQHRPSRRVFQRHWLHEQQLGTLELPVLLSGNDGSNHSGKRHGARSQ